LGLLYPALCCFDEVPEGFLRCSLMFAVNRRLCCRGLTALVNWLVFRNQYNPIAGPDGLTTQIRKEQKRSGFAGHLHTRWSRVKNHENHAHLAKPPPFNVAVPHIPRQREKDASFSIISPEDLLPA
jgi:hypothetical protein